MNSGESENLGWEIKMSLTWLCSESTTHKSAHQFMEQIAVENKHHFHGRSVFFSRSVILNCEATVDAFHVSRQSYCGENSVYFFFLNLPGGVGGGWHRGFFQETMNGKNSCQAGIQIYRL